MVERLNTSDLPTRDISAIEPAQVPAPPLPSPQTFTAVFPPPDNALRIRRMAERFAGGRSI